jgi:hypothetical protein
MKKFIWGKNYREYAKPTKGVKTVPSELTQICHKGLHVEKKSHPYFHYLTRKYSINLRDELFSQPTFSQPIETRRPSV